MLTFIEWCEKSYLWPKFVFGESPIGLYKQSASISKNSVKARVVIVLQFRLYEDDLGYMNNHCRDPFFMSTADQVQHPSDPPGVQGSSSPVVHEGQNTRRNGFQPSTKSKA